MIIFSFVAIVITGLFAFFTSSRKKLYEKIVISVDPKTKIKEILMHNAAAGYAPIIFFLLYLGMSNAEHLISYRYEQELEKDYKELQQELCVLKKQCEQKLNH